MDRWLTCANRALEFSAVGSEEDVQFSSSRAPRHRLDFQPRVFEQLLGRHAIFGLPLQHAPDKLEKHFIGYPATWQHCQVPSSSKNSLLRDPRSSKSTGGCPSMATTSARCARVV
jgi:hypothetical protein